MLWELHIMESCRIKYFNHEIWNASHFVMENFGWSGSFFTFFPSRKRVEEPDLVMGIHPGLHADGIYEFWEPTLELLLDKNIVTVFTVLNQEEYHQSLAQLDALFCKYLYKGLNPFASNHVKQTPHNADLMWASNMYLIIFKVSTRQ